MAPPSEPVQQALVTYDAHLFGGPKSTDYGNKFRVQLKFTRKIRRISSTTTDKEIGAASLKRTIWYLYCTAMGIKGAPEGVDKGKKKMRELAKDYTMAHHCLPLGVMIGGIVGAIKGVVSPIVLADKLLRIKPRE
jgi:hypothetical protein